jgi:hypothetical protein
MSYAAAGALQAAVFAHLTSHAPLTALIGSAIYDALPGGSLPALYAVLGAEGVRDRSDKTGAGADHDLTISVVTATSGFASAKAAAALICDRLIDAPLTLTRGRLVGLSFQRATAARTGTGDERRIDLIFRARIDVTP